ncbi:MAG: hypothetical protein QNJ63_01935 [Calothrix sp. MO_192.B10]|nr:hypothetical protein [Calothrix sp. MO_192.B10]
MANQLGSRLPRLRKAYGRPCGTRSVRFALSLPEGHTLPSTYFNTQRVAS